MKLTFCGAARIVTGSNYLLEVKGGKYLVDCGMFQGVKEITRLNYRKFLYDSSKIKCLFLTHAHIDHSGLIPKLYAQGFRGKVYATDATIDLCKIMLKDSAFIQEKDIERENRYRERNGLKPRKPLYTQRDASDCMSLFKKIVYDKIYEIDSNIKVRYRDAGHIIGSAIIEMFVNEGDGDKKIVFSGDLGQWEVPIIENPTLIEDADYVLVESTYGDREHEDIGIRDDLLLKHARETYEKGGRLLIPSFAIERTQELLYSFNKLIKQKKFPNEKIFLDSPLAIRATEVFKKHSEYFDQEALTKYKNPFNFPHLVYTLKTAESKKLNNYKQPCVIIAGSGMVTGGRIRHHIRHGIGDAKNKVLFVGYQAKGTTGRYILEGARSLKMMGMRIPIKAAIDKINSFSAHADVNELVKWMEGFKKKPKRVFVVHGEERSSRALKVRLEKEGFKCKVPRLAEKVEL